MKRERSSRLDGHTGSNEQRSRHEAAGRCGCGSRIVTVARAGATLLLLESEAYDDSGGGRAYMMVRGEARETDGGACACRMARQDGA